MNLETTEAAPTCAATSIKDFAIQHRLKLAKDDCDDAIIPGKAG